MTKRKIERVKRQEKDLSTKTVTDPKPRRKKKKRRGGEQIMIKRTDVAPGDVVEEKGLSPEVRWAIRQHAQKQIWGDYLDNKQKAIKILETKIRRT